VLITDVDDVPDTLQAKPIDVISFALVVRAFRRILVTVHICSSFRVAALATTWGKSRLATEDAA
jgi:hypothetical protein